MVLCCMDSWMCAAIGEIDELWETCRECNVQLIRELRNDLWEQELHNLALEYAKLGGTTTPMPINAEQVRVQSS